MAAKTTRRFGAAGQKLFTEVTGAFQLDAHELELLTQAAHTCDAMAELQRQVDKDGVLVKKDFEGPLRAHPALVELRAQRAVYARLVSALRVAGDAVERPQSTRGRPTNFEADRRGLRGLPGGSA
jgi:hypothetical protein